MNLLLYIVTKIGKRTVRETHVPLPLFPSSSAFTTATNSNCATINKKRGIRDSSWAPLCTTTALYFFLGGERGEEEEEKKCRQPEKKRDRRNHPARDSPHFFKIFACVTYSQEIKKQKAMIYF